ncbi:MAG: hypothetical protein GY827_05025 [Cytophagales bacterium]|nr:hypothetical protein [Cytophagales bacterium]
MRKKVYHLKTCSTCSRIINDLEIADEFDFQNIKEEQMTEEQVDEMAKLAGSYEALFSRRAQKYKALGLKDKVLAEQDYKQYILEEYTFLKRPVFLIGEKIFIGNTKKIIAEVAEELSK